MGIETATSTELQNNFGKYLKLVMEGKQIIVTKNGKEVATIAPRGQKAAYLTDYLRGILKYNGDLGQAKSERMKEKYEVDV